MQQCPFNEAARHVKVLLRAAACSIYEHVSTSGFGVHGAGNKLVLLGTSWMGDHRPQPPDFDTTEAKNLVEDDARLTWRGFTSFVARWNRIINVPSLNVSLDARLDDGREVTVTKAGLWYEIDEPGPLLAAPILLFGRVAGVVRVVRPPNEPFDAVACDRLRNFAQLIGLLLLEARAARELIAKIHQLEPFANESPESPRNDGNDLSMPRRDSLLEGIAAAAKELLRASDHDVAVYMWDAATSTYALRAPLKIYVAAKRGKKAEYAEDDNGVTAQVWRHYSDDVTRRLGGPPPRQIISHDLNKDLNPDSNPPGRFSNAHHIHGDAEKQGEVTRSFIAVPILSGDDSNRVDGVIRASSGELSAFSYSDVATLKALAEATQRLLLRRRAAREKERPLHALMKTIEHGVLVVDRKGCVQDMNPAARAILNDVEPPGRPIVDVLFQGRKPLERALDDAIDDAIIKPGSTLSSYVTMFFRASRSGPVPIPVRVRASIIAGDDGGRVGTMLTFEPLRVYSDVMTISGGGEGKPLKPGSRTADPDVAKEYDKCSRIGPDSSVLILGETGVGKTLLAMRVHDMSKRSTCPFVPENCAEFRPELAAAELFGTRKGAFSDAVERRGRVEEAPGGTVFLDEVAELPLPVQATLLKLIDEKRFKAVGDTKPTELNVRFVAATNADLEDLVKRRVFRADLFHRLRQTLFRLPALRDRVDLLLLADDYLQETWPGEFHPEEPWRDQLPAGFESEVIEYFLAHGWPGNFRDLRSVVTTSVEAFRASPSTSGLIATQHLPADFLEQAAQHDEQRASALQRDRRPPSLLLARRVADLEAALKELRDTMKSSSGGRSSVDLNLSASQVLMTFLQENAGLRDELLGNDAERKHAENECRRHLKNYRRPNGARFGDSTIATALKKTRERLQPEENDTLFDEA